MDKKTVRYILDTLKGLYPNPETELEHSNPFELLVATILSAQCTDARVNIVTRTLFPAFPTPLALANAAEEDVLEAIKSINFFRNKAKNIQAMAKILVEQYDSIVPADMKALESLPGVGHKTASVVMANAFGIPAFAVDTHVHRVSNRIGLVHSKNVVETEEQLKKVVPEDEWIDTHHYFILHGRRICNARAPKCELCPLREECEFYKKNTE